MVLHSSVGKYKDIRQNILTALFLLSYCLVNSKDRLAFQEKTTTTTTNKQDFCFESGWLAAGVNQKL